MKKEVYEETLRLIDSRISYLLREIQIATSKPIVIRAPLSPPLILDSAALIKNLNAERLGGLTIDEVLAKIATAAGVSSLGEYEDPITLTGNVKLKEGSNIIITRDDALNALIIASTGGLIVHDNVYHDPDYTPFGHTHVEADITNLLHDAIRIKGKTIDDSAISDGKVLVYRTSGDKLQYEDQAGGGVHGNEMHDPDFLPKNGSEALTGNLDFDQYQAVKFVLENLASAPASPVAGRSYFNTTDKKAYYYDGTQWKEFCPAGAPIETCTVSLPSGEPAESISEEVTVTETS